MAEPSMPTAHTSGSALWVRRRHQRVAPAPVTTPRKPVKQVMAPKMRLQRQRTVRGQSWGMGADRIPHYPPPPGPWHQPPGPAPPVLGPTGWAAAGFRRLLHDLGTVQVERNPHAQGPCGEGHGRRGQGGEDIAAAGERPGQRHERGGWQPCGRQGPGGRLSSLTPSPQGQKASDAFPAGSGAKGSGFRNYKH